MDLSGREAHRHIDQLRQRSRSSLICPTSTSERSSLEAERSEKSEVIPASVAGETQGPRSVRELSPVRAAIVEELPSVSTSGSVPRTNVSSPEGCVILPQSEDPVPEVARPRPLRACRKKKATQMLML
ncbi:unnamed protein product [Arctia plantaginis]|uniref:Uncharacterized protein n=1 Tax=Arctia plantaginis TaxID=874455 RepID=A0A8S1ANA5_ARCPL|nr:unnamed protein product [Arctia plantaginis]